MIEVQHVSNEFLADLASIIDVAQKQAYQQVNKIQVYTYWLLGKRIVEEEQVGFNGSEACSPVWDFLFREKSL